MTNHFVFLFLSQVKYSTHLTINDKSIDGVLGTWTQDSRWWLQTNPLSYGGNQIGSVCVESSLRFRLIETFITLYPEAMLLLFQLNLCHTNRYLFNILSSDESIWRKFTLDHISCLSSVIENSAKQLSFFRNQLSNFFDATDWSKTDANTLTQFWVTVRVYTTFIIWPKWWQKKFWSIGSRMPLKQSTAKINYMLHRMNQTNWTSGMFEAVQSLNVKANFSR